MAERIITSLRVIEASAAQQLLDELGVGEGPIVDTGITNVTFRLDDDDVAITLPLVEAVRRLRAIRDGVELP